MNTHAPVVLEHPSGEPRRGADMHGRPSASETVGEILRDVVPLIFFVPVAGPPAVLLVGPLLLLVLLLIPPAALLITLVAVLLLGGGLVVALGALIASPYLLVRHLRARHRIARPAPAVSEVAAARDERPVKQSVGPRLVHLTTR
jgi:hypothetical protein